MVRLVHRSRSIHVKVIGDTISISDGTTTDYGFGPNGTQTFTYANVILGTETAFQLAMNSLGDATANDMATRLADKINGTAAVSPPSPLQITATVNTNIVSLTNDTPGTAGNVAITDTVTSGLFSVSGMSGGIDNNRFATVAAVEVMAGDFRLLDPRKGAAWRMIEEPDKIVLVNEKTGSQFSMMLSPLAEEDYVDWPGREDAA